MPAAAEAPIPQVPQVRRGRDAWRTLHASSERGGETRAARTRRGKGEEVAGGGPPPARGAPAAAPPRAPPSRPPPAGRPTSPPATARRRMPPGATPGAT